MSDNLAGQIVRDLDTIRDTYDEAIQPARRGAGSQVKTTKTPPLPIGAHILDVRIETFTDLHFWCGFILENMRGNDDTQLATHVDLTVDGMTRFITTWVGRIVDDYPDDATNLAKETAKHARELGGIIDAPKRDWLPIGDCPITVADTEGNSIVCGASVRAYPEKQFIACPSCGTEDTMAWWMSQIVPEGADLAHADAVIACVVSRTFQPLTHEQLRQWASRGYVSRHGKDTKGRTLYSSRAVLAYAKDQTKEAAA